MPELGITTDQVRQELIALFPVRCWQSGPACYRLNEPISTVTPLVVKGRLHIDDARERLSVVAEDINKNCRLGQLSTGSCITGVRCGYDDQQAIAQY